MSSMLITVDAYDLPSSTAARQSEVRAMGKGSRIKASRRTASPRGIVVVDACEVGARDGMLTLRVGKEKAKPLTIAIPAEVAADVVKQLRPASLDAEEQYWQVIGLVVKPLGSRDPVLVAEAMEAWLLAQGWEKVLSRVPGGESGLLLVTHAGHVGLAIAPPFTERPCLVIFDPMQLRRLAPQFQGALAAAHAESPAIIGPKTVAAVLDFLAAEPWPPGAFVAPTEAQADEEMLRRHRAFLARSPFIREKDSDLRNVPDFDDGPSA